MSYVGKRKIRNELYSLSEKWNRIDSRIQRLKVPIPLDPVEWTRRNRILKGEVFNFKDRDYLLPIYRDSSSRIIIVKARQLEMTECIVNWLLCNLETHPFTTAIYTAPRMDQVSRFSRDRFRRAILDSATLREQIGGDRGRSGESAISRLSLANGSVCYLISAWGNFGAIRNIPADFVAVDETQDVQSEAIPVIEESMSHSKYHKMIMVGTASYAGSEFERLWNQSDMKEWDKSGKVWIPRKPGNRFYSGYHLDQRMAPWIRQLPPEDPNSIEGKRQRYSEMRFLNEVLGIFYRGLAKPLFFDDLLACRDFNQSLMDHLDPPSESYAGIDWGGGKFAFTVIWIMIKDDQEQWRLVYVEKFSEKDPMKQVEKIGNLIDGFNVVQAVADIGYGAVQVSELQKKFGDRVMGCQYVKRPEIPLEQKRKGDSTNRWAQMLVQADRSFWIESAIEHIKHKDALGRPNPILIIPWSEPNRVEWLIDHFTCIEMEEQETVSGKKYRRYTHRTGEPDDALHAFCYALIADGYKGRAWRPDYETISKILYDMTSGFE